MNCSGNRKAWLEEWGRSHIVACGNQEVEAHKRSGGPYPKEESRDRQGGRKENERDEDRESERERADQKGKKGQASVMRRTW